MSRRYRHDNKTKKRIYKKIFIFSEGKNTEVEYFEAIGNEIAQKIRQLYRIKFIETVGGLGNTKSIISTIIDLVKESEQNKPNILRDKGYEKDDQIWAVFDKDEFPDKDYNDAIELAQKNGIKVAYSNECFELWFLLHFEDYSAGGTRWDYYRKLSDDKMLGKLVSNKYDPNGKKKGVGKKIYETINKNYDVAKSRAEKLVKKLENNPRYSDKKPFTNVYELVESIRNINC